MELRPMLSHSGAYSRFVSPAPCASFGKKRFHRPAARAFGFSSSTMPAGDHRSRAISAWKRRSFGYTYSSKKACKRPWRSFTLPLISKSMFGTKTRHYIECEWPEPPVRRRHHQMNPEIQIFLKQLEEHARIHDAQESEHSRKLLNLEPETAAIVSILARSSRARRLLEIGTSNGYSTIWLASSVGPEGGHVVSIDRSRDKHRMAHDNLLEAGLLQYVDLRVG